MWIMRCYRFMMTVIEKEIIKFLILAFMNFREVPKIRQKKFLLTSSELLKLVSLCTSFFIGVILSLTGLMVLCLKDTSWSHTRFWQLKYPLVDPKHLLATLNWKNFGMRCFCLQDCKYSKTSLAILYLKPNFSNLWTFFNQNITISPS